MRFQEFVLVFARQRHPRRDDRDRTEDRPVLQHQPDLAVALHHLPQLGRDLAAIRTLIVEIFDDGNVAIGVSGHRDIRVAQHQGFGQHIVAVVLPPRRRRRSPDAEHERARTEQTERLAAAADRVQPA